MSTVDLPATATVHTEKSQAMTREVASSHSSGTVPKQNLKFAPPSRYQTSKSLDLADYFDGPRDMQKHSKLPFFMRIHGSVLPKMILPLIFVGLWTTLIVCLDYYIHPLGKNTGQAVCSLC